jgi:hypothetical protein
LVSKSIAAEHAPVRDWRLPGFTRPVGQANHTVIADFLGQIERKPTTFKRNQLFF